MRKAEGCELRYAYFPGCSLESTAKEYDLSVRAVCQAMGMELEELPDWNCCGASSGHTTKLMGLAMGIPQGTAKHLISSLGVLAYLGMLRR